MLQKSHGQRTGDTRSRGRSAVVTKRTSHVTNLAMDIRSAFRMHIECFQAGREGSAPHSHSGLSLRGSHHLYIGLPKCPYPN